MTGNRTGWWFGFEFRYGSRADVPPLDGAGFVRQAAIGSGSDLVSAKYATASKR